MGRPSTGIKERLMERAYALFYRQGFSATGLAQIVEEAGTTKGSFYQHFESKDDLAIAYIDHYGTFLLKRVRKLSERFPDPAQFLPAWVRLIRTDIRLVKHFSGCPILIMADHTSHLDRDRQKLLREMATDWVRELSEYFTEAKKVGFIPVSVNPDKAARRVLNSYEGAIAMWKLTHDIRHIADAEQQFLSAVGLH